jgi:hypothetical protein
MGLIISDFLLVAIVIAVIGLLIFKASLKDDISDEQLKLKEQQKLEQRKIYDSNRYTDGVPLICLNCNKSFSGPLTDDGCPSCHTSSLVITLEEYKNNAQTQTNL